MNIERLNHVCIELEESQIQFLPVRHLIYFMLSTQDSSPYYR